ncbi:Ran GTPase-binding protein MOG1 [Aspergillus homomorphus CBS 101889]|uniref:Mog1p/PsbP-like protein n=1 Tax=Aspergillus homomorphus (strain CBS 101889) TaxID=1450537 RepID=A0A395HPR6_ASPHC|nr:Mog1p/PsbP-like protein [Aspergillus homomorphus CBS 101889]RAL09616.1 Mog1p/PsbP-like protein [Aspergillus homomorphus CBS 101889]
MSTYTTQPLYGGAIKGLIPTGWIDASTLREIPDHQELYLSPTTLSSQIIELNQYVPNPTAQSTLAAHPSLLPSVSDDLDQESTDKAATLHHLLDIRDPADSLTIVAPPVRVAMHGFSANVRAYAGQAAFISVLDARASLRGITSASASGVGGAAGASGVGGGVAVPGSSGEGTLTTTTSCYFLLVRFEEQGTDLLVLVNVPQKEFEERADAEGLRGENALAGGLIEGLVRELEVLEWGLFEG